MLLSLKFALTLNLPKTQATENKSTNQNNNTAMKMVPKVNSRFPLAKL